MESIGKGSIIMKKVIGFLAAVTAVFPATVLLMRENRRRKMLVPVAVADRRYR